MDDVRGVNKRAGHASSVLVSFFLIVKIICKLIE